MPSNLLTKIPEQSWLYQITHDKSNHCHSLPSSLVLYFLELFWPRNYRYWPSRCCNWLERSRLQHFIFVLTSINSSRLILAWLKMLWRYKWVSITRCLLSLHDRARLLGKWPRHILRQIREYRSSIGSSSLNEYHGPSLYGWLGFGLDSLCFSRLTTWKKW